MRELISIVIPAYNEAEGILDFHKKLLMPAIKKHIKNYKIVYVNDGSTDQTIKKLSSLAVKDSNIKIVDLSRNFGKEIATTAGINETSGEAVIIMDADGQHPPEIIDQFISKWQNGAQVVVGVRNSNQKEGWLKKNGSKMFYQLFNNLSGSQIVPRSTDYRLIDKDVREEFLKCSERNRITRGLIDWLGFRRDYIEFDSPARLAGEASYKTSQLIKLAVNSFISLSLKPLFLFGYIGILITALSLVFGIFMFIEQFLMGDPLGLNFTGSALLGIFISFLVGLVLTAQGMMSIYLSHIHIQTQNRPIFVINKSSSINLEKESHAESKK